MLSTEFFEFVGGLNELVVPPRPSSRSEPPLKINFAFDRHLRDVLLQRFNGFEYFEIEYGDLLARILKRSHPNYMIRPW